jgi:hypothetical protein
MSSTSPHRPPPVLRCALPAALRGLAGAFLLAGAAPAVAQDLGPGPTAVHVVQAPGEGRFALAAGERPAPLVASSRDFPGVLRAVRSLQADLGRVTGHEPAVALDNVPAARAVVVVGTIGRSPLVDGLVRAGVVDTGGVAGRWEAYLVQVVERPWPGVERALVIAGSDKRGTIYGTYDLSAQIGVSPWSWWADVPVRRRGALYVLPGRQAMGPPAVRYRGIFINDEAPALSGWVQATFGGFNHRFYERVFELVLRLRGNYLWPAMWQPHALYADDSLSGDLADEYGVVLGTSHHEPMLRAHDEWSRFGSGPWNYEQNPDALRAFWRDGIRRMGSRESIVTVGMRGDGDMPMSAQANIALLERIVADQRRIIAEVTGRDPASVPQLWALYKEVQDYYDRGMRVPDDVTLLFSDDNWGNVRRLPARDAPPRAGGYGLYYHFDYVGGPRNYKWIDTNALPRIWEQLHLTYAYGVDRIWIVNVGDIKPMELPTQFFLDYAWDPSRWPAERLPAYTRLWAEQQFGPAHAAEIAAILAGYERLSARRKPERLPPTTFALPDYREAERITGECAGLVAAADRVAAALPAESRDAFEELVRWPVRALANVTELWVTVGRNRWYASQGRAAANDLAQRARELFARDAGLTRFYNDTLAGGKWRHMADQTHIGYTYWQEPRQNTMPEVREVALPVAAEMGVAIEGADGWWPADTAEAGLPEFDPYRAPVYTVDVFNRGQEAFAFEARTDAPWLVVTPGGGRVEREQRVEVRVDWPRAPLGVHRATLTVVGAGRHVVVHATVRNPVAPRPAQVRGFVEAGGYVAIEAEHFTRAVETPPVRWVVVPGLGRTLSGVTPFPVTAPRQTPGGDAPHLEYRVHLSDSGEVTVRAYVSPTLDVLATGLRYGVSFDDAPPQVVDLAADTTLRAWERAVSDNIVVSETRHHLAAPGEHVLRVWAVDPGVVLQRLVIERGTVRRSYLGPPESFYHPER